jgi:sigma-B regulation protein RsbU (phosphoserine phosphatase)
MYEMWLHSDPGLEAARQPVASRESQDLQVAIDGAESSELFCAREYREKIRALEEELSALRREQSSMQRSFFEAAQIQRRLCAPRQFHSPEFEVAGEIFPVRHLSGDFFKVCELGSAVGIIVGDIAGKGLSAGIWMPHLLSLIHSCARIHSDPADALAAANRKLTTGCGDPPLAAVFYARMDRATGNIAYCNAGLPSPLILARDHGVRHLEAGGPMLGATAAARFESGLAAMQEGDTLMACSDGVTECENRQEQEFAQAGLEKAARAFAGGSASQTLFSTLGAVLDFADGQALRDDLTLLVAERRAATILH